ncbi:MAG TPA: DNA modification methylase, partial [Verrucomicrobiota bacterium]|nr:DNA modification methylase [Verrucomicrobiota bacterium]
LIERCYPPAVRQKLCALKQAWRRRAGDPALTELLWLALVAILRPCSPAGTAQWQYVLPNKSKTALPPETAFERQTRQMWADMLEFQREARDGKASLLQDDARTCAAVPSGWADLVITSPPYANNYDYADATRLEMTFMGEIGGWGDLQTVVRRHLVRACTQHVAALKQPLEAYLAEPLLAPIHSELELVCRRLAGIRESRGGKKPYHLMLAGYFQDLAQVWHSLRRVVAPGGRVCFVIGDSAPYGVHAPVERWFGELALASGFRSFRFEKLRDRNTKWKNRKHTVPLLEGRLWVEG